MICMDLIILAQRQIIELLARERKVTRESCKKSIRLCKSYMSLMSRLDPGYSQWMGSILKKMKKSQLELLKLDLQENKIDRKEFSTQSELIWSSMDVVTACEELCTPLG